VSAERAEKTKTIARYLLDKKLIGRRAEVSYLAAGEYNENFLVHNGAGRYVFRINHGSQLGLENQIEYEYRVLDALKNSGVTPNPYWYDLHPAGIDGGVMLMEYLPGRHLDYTKDAHKAAEIFSIIHQVPVQEGDFVHQTYPISDIAAESEGLIYRFPDHPLKEEQKLLLRYRERIVRLAEQVEDRFASGTQCIVNTEVNSSNFLVDGRNAFLVDWEKAVVSTPFQDLGHFLVETSTRWKSGHIFSGEEKRAFLQVYRDRSGTELSLDAVLQLTAAMEKTILLRALSWCFMAWYEYSRTERTLQNSDTERTINQYLKEIRWFLR
jgi:aminoglycoside phosphotransferase (APT) family kinase protein